jgi:cytosine/adenosine deaminase-related metal-dependent hydrolase
MDSGVVLHRAPWVLPLSRPALADGAVALQGGRIAGVGRFVDLRISFPGAAVIDHPQSVLLPPLVNAHTHLELSNLAYLSQSPPPPTFTGWIEHMLAEREQDGFAGPLVREAARAALKEQERDGVFAVADISNTGLTREMSDSFSGELFCFKEYLGLRAVGVAPALKALEQEEDFFCTAHAPYSTHADLLKALKQRAARHDHIFPVHVAETEAETDMISQGRGELPEFLKKRGFWDNSFKPVGIDNSGSVQYLHQLGILDTRTLCVHCVHVRDEEIELLQQSRASVCLCPGSNRYLDVGRPPLDQYLNNNILPALGTDSLASNPEISIWREMRLLAEDHPAVKPETIVAMATLGGAEALGISDRYGTLESGKQGVLLAVGTEQDVRDENRVVDFLVNCQTRPDVVLIRG